MKDGAWHMQLVGGRCVGPAASCFLLPTPYYLLLTFYFLLPTSYFLHAARRWPACRTSDEASGRPRDVRASAAQQSESTTRTVLMSEREGGLRMTVCRESECEGGLGVQIRSVGLLLL